MRTCLLTGFALIAQALGSPEVTLTNGVFTGSVNAQTGIETFLGVPYAAAPVGALRFRATQPVIPSNQLRNATEFGHACVQTPAVAGQNEDCLFLNIWKNANSTSTSALPILLWIHGGSYQAGQGTNDPTVLLQRSIEIGKPFIFVGINYRLGPYGFLASAQMAQTDMNLGLQDQQTAIRFIQANAPALGGDPTAITIWGQSAGASAVSLHWLFSQPGLFRAAIMDSGAPTQYPQAEPSAFDLPGAPFSLLASLANCTKNSLECLRDLPFNELFNATNTLLQRGIADPTFTAFPPALHGFFITEHCSKRIVEGNFNKVPLMLGTNEDEGTVFTLTTTNSTADITRMLTSIVNPPTAVPVSVINEILNLYPDDPALGSPFDTGNDTFGLSPEYKRAAAIFGDWKYHSSVRFVLQNARKTQQVFNYNFRISPSGAAPRLGVPHGSELEVALFPATVPIPADQLQAAQTLQDAYLNFVSDGNPGGENGLFPLYGPQGLVTQFNPQNITVITDSYRAKQINFFIDHLAEFLK